MCESRSVVCHEYSERLDGQVGDEANGGIPPLYRSRLDVLENLTVQSFFGIVACQRAAR